MKFEKNDKTVETCWEESEIDDAFSPTMKMFPVYEKVHKI